MSYTQFEVPTGLVRAVCTPKKYNFSVVVVRREKYFGGGVLGPTHGQPVLEDNITPVVEFEELDEAASFADTLSGENNTGLQNWALVFDTTGKEKHRAAPPKHAKT